MGFNEKVLRLTGKIPKGKVTTYKEIAKKLRTKAYRAVGNALRENKKLIVIPCHRVVKSNGALGGYCGEVNSKKKRFLLEKEGIKVKGNKIIDFRKRLFIFKK